ncbi:NAD/NADP-dependent octopine/nopaline dehydrogenase family protein [Pseudoruegeria sp. SK021]|uniref:NAD/NADP-dependent octopine/nopaline dehydrogenase family protein n=1 Tax=Pseudoruegeria sp. SK021 TaxID=1933035 RepID=UPI000A24AA09|nr:NAD/NADP-dependent octopine/nopaline dehydrogenase family protein [Pseudoruegeria sp. SK021]OSP54201.1 NAD/NADP octopine/nopaline dehydrogenase [Pseudoruegeria sp. SK021]
MSGSSMKVGIAGAGAIAFGTAALLQQNGHAPMLWSPSGARTKALAAGTPLTAKGAIEDTFAPAVAADAAQLARDNDVILLALPAYGHKAVMDALAPHLRADQPVIISSHASLGALYLARLLAARGIKAPIIAWGTTVTTGRQPDLTHVQVNTVRARVDMCVLPDTGTEAGFALCQSLFGDRFVLRDGLLAISLSNLNPQNHMGIALGNMSRMERGETWGQGQNLTPKIGTLLEALDLERLAIAEALNLPVRTIFEHFHLSFHVPVASISEMNQAMHAKGTGGTGPASADSRYVTEDVPYGLVVTVALGKLAGCPAPLHQAGVTIFSAMYGRDFTAENQLLPSLGLSNMTLDSLQAAARTG